MKTENFYYYFMDCNNIKSEYLINDLYSKVDQKDKQKFASIIGPTNVNVDEIILNISDDVIILKIDADAFFNCKELKRIIVPNTIMFIEKNSFPIQSKIIVENKEYSVDEYIKYIKKNNALKLISEIKLILPCLNDMIKIIKIVKKSKNTIEAEKVLFTFLNSKIKMNEYDSKKAVSLILSLKLQVIVSLEYDKLKKKIVELEMEL